MLKYCCLLPISTMRRQAYTAENAHFECADCGTRVESPGSRVCENCEGPLQNLSVPRAM